MNPRKDDILVYFDGSCEPINPCGNMGFGFVVKQNDKNLTTGFDGKEAHYDNSNNVAEYSALKLALLWLLENGHQDEYIFVMGDSKLVIMQMTGEWKMKAGRYLEKAKQTVELSMHFKNLFFKWIPREQNTEADELSNMWEAPPDEMGGIDFYEPPACLL